MTANIYAKNGKDLDTQFKKIPKPRAFGSAVNILTSDGYDLNRRYYQRSAYDVKVDAAATGFLNPSGTDLNKIFAGVDSYNSCDCDCDGDDCGD